MSPTRLTSPDGYYVSDDAKVAFSNAERKASPFPHRCATRRRQRLVGLTTGPMVSRCSNNAGSAMQTPLRSLGAATLLAITLSGCETKVAQISAVCRPGDQPTEPVRWFYTSKVDPTLIKRVSPAIDITLHYTGADPRAVPPITTYFFRENGATLRVASSAKASMPSNGTFTYHVDTGGYIRALTTSGRGGAEEAAFVIEVDDNYFGGLLSTPTCLRWPDHHLDLAKASEVPNLKDKHPLNMAAADWIGVSTLPTVVMRQEGSEISTYAFFVAPVVLTETKNATNVPDDVAKQAAEVGVTAMTPTYSITGQPTPRAGDAPTAAKGG